LPRAAGTFQLLGRSLVMCVAVAFIAAAAAVPAQASRAPTRSERVSIIRATDVYVAGLSDCCAVVPSGAMVARVRVVTVRVSTVNPRWALVAMQAYDAKGRSVGPVTASLHRASTLLWSVLAFGAKNAGCVMPHAVRRDLNGSC
jgi:hypothetical protein